LSPKLHFGEPRLKGIVVRNQFVMPSLLIALLLARCSRSQFLIVIMISKSICY
jgi:hypothetical protein